MQLAKRNNRSLASKALTVPVLMSLINSRGEDWVVQQVQNGVMFLTNQARTWWSSRTVTAPQSAMVAVQAPTSVGVAMRGSAKMQGNMRFKHREMIAESIVDGTHRFRVSPGDANTFPYLSTLSTMFDQYQFHSVRLVVVSATATTTAGRWYAAWDPDSEDPKPNGAVELMAMRHSLSMTAWQSGELTIPGGGKRYLSYFTDTLKDHGHFIFQKFGGSFDLFIEYDVSLLNPNVVSAVEVVKNSTLSLFTTGLIPETFGPEFIRASGVAKSFDIPSGVFHIVLGLAGTTLALGNTVIAALDGSSVESKSRSVVSGGTRIHHEIVVRCSSPVRIAILHTFATLTNDRCHLVVTPISTQQYYVIADAILD